MLRYTMLLSPEEEQIRSTANNVLNIRTEVREDIIHEETTIRAVELGQLTTDRKALIMAEINIATQCPWVWRTSCPAAQSCRQAQGTGEDRFINSAYRFSSIQILFH